MHRLVNKARAAFVVVSLAVVTFLLFQNMSDSKAYFEPQLGMCVLMKSGERVLGARNAGTDGQCSSVVGKTFADYKPSSSVMGSEFIFVTARKADFSNNTILGSVFHNSKLHGATFAGSKIAKTNFLDSDLSSAEFTGAEFDQAIFRGGQKRVSLVDGRFMNSKGNVRFDYSDLALSNFSKANLQASRHSGASLFYNVDAKGANLSHAVLNGEIEKSDFTGADFTGAQLENSIIAESKFVNAKFGGANLKGKSFCGSVNFDRADFTQAELVGIGIHADNDSQACQKDVRLDFSKATLKGATISVRSAGCSDANCSRVKVIFAGADLRGTDLSKWPLAVDTDFSGAVYSASTKLPFNAARAASLKMKRID